MVWLWRKRKFSCCCSHLSFIGSTEKSWSLSSQLRVSVSNCRLLKVVYYYFFIHLWVISSSRARHMNGCAWKLYSVLCFPLWMMFTIYLWKHGNNKTLYIAFQFAVRADKIFLSWAELHTLGDAVGPTWNNKTLQREAGTVEFASEAWALHWPQYLSAVCHLNTQKAAMISVIYRTFNQRKQKEWCVDKCAQVCVPMHRWRPEEDIRCSTLWISALYLETGSLTRARLATKVLSNPTVLGLHAYMATPGSLLECWGSNSVLMHVQQILLPAEPSL